MVTQRNIKLIYLLLLTLAICWSIATLLPAYWAANGNYLWAIMARQCFAPLCHQLTERSFYLWHQPLAVCARCSGIYAGLVVGLLIYPLWPLWRNLADEQIPQRIWLLVALAPTTIDFLLGWTGLWANTHYSRAFTGLLAGIGLAYFLLPALVSVFQDLSRKSTKVVACGEEISYGNTKQG